MGFELMCMHIIFVNYSRNFRKKKKREARIAEKFFKLDKIAFILAKRKNGH